MKTAIKIIVVIGISFILIQNSYLVGIYTGYGIGLERFDINMYATDRQWVSHSDLYEYFSNFHVYCNWLLVIYLIVSFLEPRRFIQVARLILISCFVCLFSYMYLEKPFGQSYVYQENYLYVLNASKWINIEILIIGGVLLMIEIFSIVLLYIDANRKKTQAT